MKTKKQNAHCISIIKQSVKSKLGYWKGRLKVAEKNVKSLEKVLKSFE